MPRFGISVFRLAGAILSLLFAVAGADAQEYRFQFLGIEQGLTNLAIKNIYQDSKGFLWVSTENGIFRYDGFRFRSFGRDEGIPPSSGVAFGEAPDGTLLAGGDIGLYRMAGNRFEKIPLPGASTVNWAGGVKSDSQGHTWLATESGLMALTKSSPTGALSIRRLATPPGVTGSVARGIFVEKDVVWYGCGLELCRMSGEGTAVYATRMGLPPAIWRPIGRARDGGLWVRGRGVGLAVLARGASVFKKRAAPLAASGVTGMPAVDSEGSILFPSPDGLVIREKEDWWKIGRSAGLRGTVYSVFQDRDGSLWIGLAGRGLARWLGYGEWQSWTADSGLGSDLVYEILPRPDGSLWVGTESGLVHGVRQGKSILWRKQSAIGNTPVHSVRAEPDGTLWIGAETRGVGRVDPATGAVDWIGSRQGLDAKSSYAVNVDRNRRVWAATENGLFVADLPFRAFRRVAELPRVRFWTVMEAKNGDIWAGGASGVFHLAGTAWQRFTSAEGLSGEEVISLGAAPNGDVWVGYRFSGEIDRLSSVRGRLRLEHMTRPRNDAPGLAYFLGFDSRGRLWAGTDRGLDVWEAGQWTHLDSNDGLAWDDCDLNGFAAEPDGTIWIGTSGGLSRFSPRPRTASNYRPTAVFTSLTLGSKDIAPADRPSVDYRSNALVARYSALNFAHPGTLSFRYRLSPLFDDWRTTFRRELEFPGLPPGSYRLEVQAVDRSQAASADTAVFSFEIGSPWFRSWWFMGLCTLTPIMLTAFGIRVRIAVMRGREAELVGLVEKRTADLRKANEELTRLSSLDGLTGVANRRALDQILEREWARVARTGEPLSLALLDVDHFKMLNDSEGHQRGDECLIRIASELRRLVKRETDLVARYGGEEFAIVLAGMDAADAARFADGVRRSIADLGLTNLDSPVKPVVTVSVGVGTAWPGSFPDAAEFLATVDDSLYAAKRSGRNRVVSSNSPERALLEEPQALHR